MEHLPSPRSRDLAKAYRTRCVAHVYDGGPMDFLHWPEQNYFADLYALFQPHKREGKFAHFIGPEETGVCESFLQTWLYFGLLHTFLHAFCRSHTFIREIEGQAYLDTSKLGLMLTHLDYPETPSVQVIEYRRQCLVLVKDMLFRAEDAVPEIDKNIVISIIVLAEILERANRRAANPQEYHLHDVDTIKWPGIWPGLCNLPVHLENSLEKYFLSVRVYVESCARIVADQSGDMSLSKDTYKHCCSTRDCPLTRIDGDEVQKVLESGDIAVIKVAESSQLDIISAKDCGGYIALSHVWSKGLGNPSDNALPQCRIKAVLEAIRRLCSRTSMQPIFWLDTLCCPANSSRHRDMCLSRMEQIYRNAAYVLIIDPPLSHTRREDVDDLELTARLLLSSWTTRLWTFQEGMLARRLYLLMKDDFVDVDALRGSVSSMVITFEHLPVVIPLCQGLDVIRPFNVTGRAGREMDSVEAYRGCVRNRELTVRTDEVLCLSTCLGVDKARILAAKVEDRMMAFWMAYVAGGKEIPRSIIFFYGDRLIRPGHRWSPESIVYTPQFNLEPFDHGQWATPTSEGLLLKYPGWSITGKGNGSQPRRRDCRSSEGGWYMLVQNTSEEFAEHHLPFLPSGVETMTLIAGGPLMKEPVSRSINCLGGQIRSSLKGTNYFTPYGHCEVYMWSRDEQDVKERAWRSLGALQVAAGSESKTRTILRDDKKLKKAKVVDTNVMSVAWFKDLALEMLDNPVLEIKEVWPESQTWCVG